MEERLNTLTHSIGAGLGIGALCCLIARSSTPRATAAFTIYGVSQILLYLSSALTHLFSDVEPVHAKIRVIDQVSVYFLIAGTYTPVALLILEAPQSMIMIILIWSLALVGIIGKTTIYRGKHLFTDLLYLPMGWMVVFFLPQVLKLAPEGFLPLLISGAVCYTTGVYFYATKKIPYAHVIWHLFVLGGSISFFLAFLTI